MDINQICISGRLFDIGVNESRQTDYPVVEAKLSVLMRYDKDNNEVYDEFNVRSYGKKSTFISTLPEGVFVVITGMLKEDIRVNANDPNTTRSKTYINIDKIKTIGFGKGDYIE